MACLTVSQVNQIIKSDIESDIALKSLQVSGEVSNFKNHSSGHFYFTLKDQDSRINCVMFSTYASKLNIKIEDGMKIMVKCSVGVYISSGSYQLYVYNIEPIGLGTLYLQYEQLKQKLYEEGLFNEEKKKPIPKFATNIGVISAKEGAAIQDVITTIKRRWPIANITLFPSLVQGKLATDDLANNLQLADTYKFDIIIIARGGGSIEDLWCFNEEKVARIVANMNTPTISAVGHETDFTIIDYVSDCRAPTPTAAAELATPNIVDVLSTIESIKNRLIISINNKISEKKTKLDSLSKSKYLLSAETIFAEKQMKLNLLTQKLINTNKESLYYVSHSIEENKLKLINLFDGLIKTSRNKLINLEGKLDSLSPLKVLGRGYGIIEGQNGSITSIYDANIGDNIAIKLVDGTLEAEITNKKEK